MLHKDNKIDWKTTTGSIITDNTQLYSSQTLSPMINKQQINNNQKYRTSPIINFVDITSKKSQLIQGHKQWNSPFKNSSNKNNKTSLKFLNYSKTNFGEKSPQIKILFDESPNGSRLSFRKSGKSITKRSRQQNKKQQSQSELIISLKQIRRLRQIIQTLTKDNRTLKRIVHEILQQKFSQPFTSFSEFQYSLFQKSLNNSERSISYDLNLNTQKQQNHEINHRILNNQLVESFKTQNHILTESLSQVQSQLNYKIKQLQYIQQSLKKHQVINKELQQQNKALKQQYSYCSQKIKQLEYKIKEMERLNQEDIRLSRRTTVSISPQQDQQQISIVEHQIVSSEQQQQLPLLSSMLKDQQLNQRSQQCKVCTSHEAIAMKINPLFLKSEHRKSSYQYEKCHQIQDIIPVDLKNEVQKKQTDKIVDLKNLQNN